MAAFYVVLGCGAVLPAPAAPRAVAGRAAGCVVRSGAGAGKSAGEGGAIPIARPSAMGRPLACSFVAVGHGIACIVELPDGRTILYDCGKLGSPLGAVRPTSAVLWSRGIHHLDAIVISHADADHFSGVPELLDRFSVNAIYVSPVMFEHPQPAVEELVAAIEQAGVPLKPIHAGDRLRGAEGVRLEVLHPPRKGVIGSDNANSILLLIEYAGRRVLLTGDLESPGLDDVLAEEPLDCDVGPGPAPRQPAERPDGLRPVEHAGARRHQRRPERGGHSRHRIGQGLLPRPRGRGLSHGRRRLRARRASSQRRERHDVPAASVGR